MTDNQINRAIAEVCGWTDIRDNMVGKAPGETSTRVMFLPLYCSNLNAMHEAEKAIFPYYATVYANKLARVTKADYSDDTEYFCATARQRAEAFLMALGKYKATTEESSAVQNEVQP